MIICRLPAMAAKHSHVKVQKRLLNTDILSAFKSVNTLCVISTSLLCFKGGCCWFRCYFWQNDWLVGTSLSETPETGNARGTVMSTWSLSSWKQSWLCLEAGAPRLFSPESSRPAVPLSYSHTPLPPPSLPLSGHQQAESMQQVDLSPWPH